MRASPGSRAPRLTRPDVGKPKVLLADDPSRRTVSEGPLSRLTLFGNMVVPLITDGNAAAAIALESQ